MRLITVNPTKLINGLWGLSRNVLARLSYKPAKNLLSLSDEQKAVFETLEQTDRHVFITGKAGTGKSVLLKYFAQHTHKKIVKVAPTGIAALNIHGQTIHSLFKLPTGIIEPQKIRVPPETRQTLRGIDAVVIDEISMVRADIIDGIDQVLRIVKGRNTPFGGVQLIVFGDVYQLPPVIQGREMAQYFSKKFGGAYFFNASAWEQTTLSVYELGEVFRQSGKEFKSLLNAIREGRPGEQIIDRINQRLIAPEEIPTAGMITLTSTNTTAQAINKRQLSALKGKPRVYTGIVTNKFPVASLPTDQELTLKVGAQVVFIKNDPAGRWANGTIGRITALSKSAVKVRSGKKTFSVTSMTWEGAEYQYDADHDKIIQNVTGTFSQLPLKLAWAMTIHKSQGCTFHKVAIDLGKGAFAHGQTYVALSRCRSLTGLFLLSAIRPSDVILDPAVIGFMHRYTATKATPVTS